MFDRAAIDRMGGWSLPVPAFEWIFSTIPAGSKILEFGAGKGSEILSTIFNVVSIENDPRFVNSSSVIHAEIKPTPAATERGQAGWFDRDALVGKLPEDYDLLIVDAPTRKIGRSGILDNFDLLRADRPAVVDDVNRPAEKEIADALQDHLNARKTILTCDVFPYRQTAILEP